MKNLFYLCCLLFICSFAVNAQTFEDVVFLKNGSILHGIIIEQIPNQSIKVQTRDGNVFDYNLADVEKITKEQVNTARTSRNAVKDATIPVNPNVRKLYPWLSFGLSFLCPGAGQIYNGQKVKGGMMIGLYVAGLAGMVYSSQGMYADADYNDITDSYSGEIDYSYAPLYALGLVVVAFDWTWSVISAPVAARRINRRNGLSFNYKLNNNIDIALKPDYKLNFGGNNNFYPVLGAKLSFNFH